MFVFRVTGLQEPTGTIRRAFNERYKMDGEHPADALEKLVHEIEWGILDGYESFSITYICEED